MARLGLAAATGLAAVAAFVPSAASAHGEGGVTLTAVVEGVSPPVPGLHVAALPSVSPLLEVRNDTGLEVVVLGEHGEPFLRIGPHVVEGNVRSSTFRAPGDPFGTIVPQAPSGGSPEWRRLSSGRGWRWFDHRLRVDSARPGARASFTVPLAVGGERVLVRGFVQVGEVGHLRSVLDRTPAIPGLEVRLLEGRVPALFVRNDTARRLEVLGLEDEPFLRIGPQGVRANTHSPTYYRAGGQTIRPAPAEADPAARPRWARLSARPTWAWLEYRARVPEEGVRPFVLGDRSGTVARWTTRLRLGGKAFSIAGHVEWVPARRSPPARGGSLSVWLVAATIAAGALLVAGRWFGSRRRG